MSKPQELPVEAAKHVVRDLEQAACSDDERAFDRIMQQVNDFRKEVGTNSRAWGQYSSAIKEGLTHSPYLQSFEIFEAERLCNSHDHRVTAEDARSGANANDTNSIKQFLASKLYHDFDKMFPKDQYTSYSDEFQGEAYVYKLDLRKAMHDSINQVHKAEAGHARFEHNRVVATQYLTPLLENDAHLLNKLCTPQRNGGCGFTRASLHHLLQQEEGEIASGKSAGLTAEEYVKARFVERHIFNAVGEDLINIGALERYAYKHGLDHKQLQTLRSQRA